jgi:two-component system, NtrC family, nitrogen regulation sensor histidine kinase NtrY
MGDYIEAKQQDLRRRRRERYLIACLFVVISILTYIGTHLLDLGVDLPLSSSILVFALININVVLLLLLLFLTVRNLVKLIFERRKNIMGGKLRTKLVLAFVTLSLLPTAIIFFISVQFISSALEYWFNLKTEQSLQISLEVGRDYYDRVADEILSFGNNISRVITYEGYLLASREDDMDKFVDDKLKEYRLNYIEIFSRKMESRSISKDHCVDLTSFKGVRPELLENVMEKGMDARFTEASAHGDLIYGAVPIFSRTESKAVVGLALVARFVPGTYVNRLQAISRGLQEYRQLKMLKKPIKFSHMITLSIVTLLIIFSSVWFGFYLSREITIPIKELADGTKRIASGNYDFFIDLEATDEIGVLVNSFNRMTMDLKTSKHKLEEANVELVRSNLELEQRRLYMEFVLANVAAGVVSTDAEGKVLTINKSAQRMLGVSAEMIIGRNYQDLLLKEYAAIMDRFMNDRNLFKKGYFKKQVKVSLQQKELTLLVSLNVMSDENGNFLGLVAVFEDLSDIEKAQRMAAWREVARRIAHEVKNPLTPIQLSAQRLKKRYENQLPQSEVKVFRDCTEMIINQVDELKNLVDEFSKFARMPASNPVPSDINAIVTEAMGLFREAHKDVSFVFENSRSVPVFNLDREQIKRMMVNLFDNAIEAMNGKGEIRVSVDYDSSLQTARIKVSDTGRGISPEDKSRMFEPYFSTKKHGTGLGLSIVNTIVTDHNGFIRVRDNSPVGTVFIIELPVRV